MHDLKYKNIFLIYPYKDHGFLNYFLNFHDQIRIHKIYILNHACDHMHYILKFKNYISMIPYKVFPVEKKVRGLIYLGGAYDTRQK